MLKTSAERSAYVRGYTDGMKEVLASMRNAYQSAGVGMRLAEMEAMLIDYGVDLDDTGEIEVSDEITTTTD